MNNNCQWSWAPLNSKSNDRASALSGISGPGSFKNHQAGYKEPFKLLKSLKNMLPLPIRTGKFSGQTHAGAWKVLMTATGGLVAISLCVGVYAQSSDIYVCVDANGKKEFKNTGDIKGCKKLQVEPNLVPHSTIAITKPASPAGFPKVDGDTQKARDSDRKRILEDELQAQQDKLADLKKTYNNGAPERTAEESKDVSKYQAHTQKMKEDIQRAEADIGSIKSELAKLQ